jgi:hypothetical protein
MAVDRDALEGMGFLRGERRTGETGTAWEHRRAHLCLAGGAEKLLALDRFLSR